MKNDSATLRDEFAMAAMQGWLAGFGSEQEFPNEKTRLSIAKQCYQMADVMMLVRESTEAHQR